MSILSSTYRDGWFPTEVARVFPNGLSGDRTAFPFGMARGYATWLWWRVQEFRVYAAFSGTRHYSGTTGGGAPWAYTETYGGTLDKTLNLSDPADLSTASDAFGSAASNVGVNESAIFQKLFQFTINAPSHSFAWDFPPPTGAPTLPSNYTESNTGGLSINGPVSPGSVPIVESGGLYWPSLGISLPPCGSTSDPSGTLGLTLAMPFKDTGGNTIGTLNLYGSALASGLTVSGYVQWAGNWPAT